MERLRLLVEGVNNKIRVLQRRAYGYRDEEYLKLKIVAAFLPPLPRNAGRVDPSFRILQRRAYGYRDEEYLKLKIVAAFLPPLPRNAVFNPHESA